MDFGVLGLDGLVGSENGISLLSSDPETKQKWYGSGHLNQEGSGVSEVEERSSKLVKSDDVLASKTLLLHQRNTSPRYNVDGTFFPDAQQREQMLSFSSPKADGLLFGRGAQNVALPYVNHLSSVYNRITGSNSASLNGGNVHGIVAGARGPFTPSQWIELEHQALIYKYIISNVPVPSNLLIPIRRALEPAGFSGFSGGILRPNTLGWGSFCLGFSKSADPEPGRCRRTDGKKWRCSRDAVIDQKYCERHMNRGRHRSRKPVEGQNGHSVVGTTTSSSKLMPTAPSSALVLPSDGASNSLTTTNQVKNTLDATNLSAANCMDSMFLNKDNVAAPAVDTPTLSILSSSTDLRQQIPCQSLSRDEFGLVSSDALLNPSHKISSFVNCRDFSSQDPKNEEAESHRLCLFIEDWPKTESDSGAAAWSALGMQSDESLLSMSIPMATPHFVSLTTSPAEKVSLSPPRPSLELDLVHSGLKVGSVLKEPEAKQGNWLPMSWETSIGGPLGEVLHNTNNSIMESSTLNLMTIGRDAGPCVESSPSGVSQKSNLASLSNSSFGHSPEAENKTHEGASLCDNLLTSALGNASVPAL